MYSLKYIKDIFKNQDIFSMDQEQIEEYLKDYIGKRSKKPLSYGTRRNILIFIKNMGMGHIKIPRAQKVSYTINNIALSTIKNALQYLFKFIDNDTKFVRHQTALAAALTLITNLRISEIYRLTWNHLYALQNDITIPIRIKKKFVYPCIIPNKILLNRFLEKTKKFHKNKNNFILKAHKTQLNKKFKQLLNYNGRLGLSSIIRKLNTSVLISKNAAKYTIQTFNRHEDIQTSLAYYNIETNDTINYLNQITI